MTLPPETQKAVARISGALDLAKRYGIDAVEFGEGRSADALDFDDLRTILTALSEASAREGVLEGALVVISNASERSEAMFGGEMSDVTRVFQHITRVARTALSRTTPTQDQSK